MRALNNNPRDKRAAARWLMVLGVALASLASSQVLAKAPKGRYVIANGQVTDTKTKLVWRQQLNPASVAFADTAPICTGLADGPWRVPNVKELQTLVDETEQSPTIDEEAFPDAPAAPLWTSTPDVRDPDYAWAVSFSLGSPGHYTRVSTFQVRCVK